MKKTGMLILIFSVIQSYVLTYNINIINVLTVNYITIYGLCVGLCLISYNEFKQEKNKLTKYLFWNVIFLFGGVIILTYTVDLIIDEFFGTSKIIFTSIVCITISLCIYSLKR